MADAEMRISRLEREIEELRKSLAATHELLEHLTVGRKAPGTTHVQSLLDRVRRGGSAPRW